MVYAVMTYIVMVPAVWNLGIGCKAAVLGPVARHTDTGRAALHCEPCWPVEMPRSTVRGFASSELHDWAYSVMAILGMAYTVMAYVVMA